MKSRIYYNRQAVLVVRHYNGFKDKISPHLMYHINTSDDFVSVNFILENPRLYNEIIGIITVSIYEDGNYIHDLKEKKFIIIDGFPVGKGTDGKILYSSSTYSPNLIIDYWMPIPKLKEESK